MGKGLHSDPQSSWAWPPASAPRPLPPPLRQACGPACAPPASQVSLSPLPTCLSQPPGSLGPVAPHPVDSGCLLVSPCVRPLSSQFLLPAWPLPFTHLCPRNCVFAVCASVGPFLHFFATKSSSFSNSPSPAHPAPPFSPLPPLWVSPSVPPPCPLPRAPCPSTLTDSCGVLSYGLVQAKFSILLAFFPLWVM